MGSKTYRWEQTLGKDETMKRAAPMVDSMARKYMMKREDLPDGFVMKGKGVDAKIVITDNAIEITVELGMLLEAIARGQIESELNYRVPKTLA